MAESDEGFQVRDRRHQADEPPSPSETSKEPRSAASAPPPREERSLVGLFVMLASLAVAALEGPSDPSTGQGQRDPTQAAELIDLLMLLREKTEGHRSPDETQALEEIIYDLQVRYVNATRRSSPSGS